ncbi:hypothetical protein MML48_5g00004063 [Holotrichia oblita]|uniref:Uncharacterized protein n=1 Tax=Holotrichia oblita TaxID=644536 RepID=A0ACB9T177_HOLOL|nr:hypothetical protein MML48_5g00004063 [Holotrichia oblita]
MVLNHISTVLRQARLTFTSSSEAFRSNLEILKHLLDKTTATDVNLHPQFMTESLWMKPDKAPVTYIGIYENDLLTMGIFILSPDMKLPLHDHPQIEDPSVIYSNDPPLKFSAEKHPDEFMETISPTCILDPKQRNIHEIESVDGPAAFLDILSPPYC